MVDIISPSVKDVLRWCQSYGFPCTPNSASELNSVTTIHLDVSRNRQLRGFDLVFRWNEADLSCYELGLIPHGQSPTLGDIFVPVKLDPCENSDALRPAVFKDIIDFVSASRRNVNISYDEGRPYLEHLGIENMSRSFCRFIGPKSVAYRDLIAPPL